MTKLYSHPNMPTIWIAIDGDNLAWIVPAVYKGWHQRRTFTGNRTALIEHNSEFRRFFLDLPK